MLPHTRHWNLTHRLRQRPRGVLYLHKRRWRFEVVLTGSRWTLWKFYAC